MTLDIVVKQRSADEWVAWLENETSIWQSGRSRPEAIGMLILSICNEHPLIRVTVAGISDTPTTSHKPS